MAKPKKSGHGVCAKCGKDAVGSWLTADDELIGACSEHVEKLTQMMAMAIDASVMLAEQGVVSDAFASGQRAADIAARVFRGFPEMVAS